MTTLILSKEKLPDFRPQDGDTVSSQLAHYFRQLLENHLDPNNVHALQLPSVLELACVLNCCEMDIFEALYELKHQAYEYEIHGIDTSITLKDRVFRKHTNLRKSRHFIMKALASCNE